MSQTTSNRVWHCVRCRLIKPMSELRLVYRCFGNELQCVDWLGAPEWLNRGGVPE